MNRYNIKIIQKKIVEFNWDAKNKKEAKKVAYELVEDTDILKHHQVHFEYEIEDEIKKIGRSKKWKK